MKISYAIPVCNEINELQDDTLCKSEELFTLMKKLNELIN